MEEFFVYLYPLVGFISVVGYVPQLRKLIFATRPTEQTSVGSWIIWTISSFIGFGYSFYHIKDYMLISVSGINFVMCSFVLLLLVYNVYFRFSGSKASAEVENI